VRRLVVLANRGAGGADDGALAGAIATAFEGKGAAADLRWVPGDRVEAAARQALHENPDTVVAAGGDGTVGAVAAALAGSGTPMAVLPLGTLNHFARDAGLPLRLEEAAGVAVEGVAVRVDVAEVNGNVFVNNSSIGVYPRTVRERERRRQETATAAGPGAKAGRLATVRAAWSVLRRLPAHHVTLAIDGRPVVRTTSFVFVGNNLYETGFGHLGHRASLSGGTLGVYHAKRPGRRALLALAGRALVGRLDGSSDLQADEASRLTVHAARHDMRVALDGEVRRLRLPLEYRSRPGDLLLLRPRRPGGAA
jgi:diacylglycerol kinase family enzyme